MTLACSLCMPMTEEPLLAARFAARNVAARMALAGAPADFLPLALALVVVVLVFVAVEESLRMGNVVDDATAAREPARGM